MRSVAATMGVALWRGMGYDLGKTWTMVQGELNMRTGRVRAYDDDENAVRRVRLKPLVKRFQQTVERKKERIARLPLCQRE
jgi:hypothetical protein